MRLPASLTVFLTTALLTTNANAAFHLMKVVEVFAGTQAAPNAQYVMLQMYSAGQNIVNNHDVTISDASGANIDTFTFVGNVPENANQSYILIATMEAQT